MGDEHFRYVHNENESFENCSTCPNDSLRIYAPDQVYSMDDESNNNNDKDENHFTDLTARLSDQDDQRANLFSNLSSINQQNSMKSNFNSLNNWSKSWIIQMLNEDPLTFLTFGHRQIDDDLINCSISINDLSTNDQILFSLLISDQNEIFPLMIAEKHKKLLGSTYYTIHLCEEKKATKSIGRVTCLSKLGTQFQVELDHDDQKENIAFIEYEKNFLGFNGPRRFSVNFQKRNLVENCNSIGDCDDQWIQVENEIPRWDENSNSYVIKFTGKSRAISSSLNNFRLIESNEKNRSKTLMEHGKTSSCSYSCDFRCPLSFVQAFSISLTSFDSWIFRE